MRVAISTDGEYVSEHFGRCPSFTIVDLETGGVARREEVGNPGHQPGYIPEFLHGRGVQCIVAGGMGTRATDIFQGYGIRTITGVNGRVDDVIGKLRTGSLEGGASLCRPGAGKGYGVEKAECDHPHEKHD